MIDLAEHRIMAVDDEPDNLSVLKATLEMINNSNVFIAASCEEAIRNLTTYDPTIILTDLSMPREDGYALLYKVRHHEKYGVIPVIALTAHAMQGDKERIMQAGFDGYISKPFNILSIGDEISAQLEQFIKQKDQSAKDQGAEDQSAKDQGAKDQNAKDQSAPVQSAKDQGAKDQNVEDQNAKEVKALDITADMTVDIMMDKTDSSTPDPATKGTV